ncbi:hypothetical protein [Rhodobacter sp. NTK016B]|nr:hypothetical protein [Rhodobacter sp. NTK016B]
MPRSTRHSPERSAARLRFLEAARESIDHLARYVTLIFGRET